MSCAGRLPPLCASSFPEVLNYDYETNIATRGIENTSFRWEEVYVTDTWLMLEATTGSTFEGNSATPSLTGYYLSRSGTADTTHYQGYTLTGGYTLYIGTSGVTLTSSTLTGFAGSSFVANPIEGTQSVGLYCYSNDTPKVITSSIDASNIGIATSQRHQFYALATCNYSPLPTQALKPYIVGYVGGSPVAYCNASGYWQATVPSIGITVATTGYTEMRFEFVTTGFPGSTPTSYKVIVESAATGAFFTIDDIHVDQYMKRNPFVNYILPTGYFIQMTPDLGWEDILEQFGSNPANANPYLTTLGPFTLDNGNLADNLDNTVTATLDTTAFDSVTNNKYTKYLWRAVAVSPDGSPGDAGFPQRFEFIGRSIEQHFEVTTVLSDPTSSVKIITGTRLERMTVLVDGQASYPGLTYPTDTTWRLVVILDSGARVLELRGKDLGGALTSPRYVRIDNQLFAQNEQALWNEFDDHGLLLDLPRLPNEDNSAFKKRINDTLRYPGGQSFVGVVNGATRELGVRRIPDALTISMPLDVNAESLHNSVRVKITSTKISVRTDAMQMTERVLIDPVYGTADLSKRPTEIPDHLLTIDQVDVNKTSISIDLDEETPSTKRIKVSDVNLYGQFLDVTYQYEEELFFAEYATVGELMTALQAVRDHTDQQLLDCKMSYLLSGGESVFGLYLTDFTLTPGASADITWSPVILRKIADKEYREYFLGEDGYRATTFYQYVTELKSISRSLWGSVQIDRDRWDAADSKDLSFDHLPTTFDPHLSDFRLAYTGASTRIDGPTAYGRRYLGLSGETLRNIGINQTAFQPGVGHTPDLEPGVFMYTTNESITEGIDNPVSAIRQNNNYILFSGQF